MKALYLAVTADEYELPLCVFDSVKELAEWAGVLPARVSENLYHKCKKCKFRPWKYERIVLD